VLSSRGLQQRQVDVGVRQDALHAIKAAACMQPLWHPRVLRGTHAVEHALCRCFFQALCAYMHPCVTHRPYFHACCAAPAAVCIAPGASRQTCSPVAFAHAQTRSVSTHTLACPAAREHGVCFACTFVQLRLLGQHVHTRGMCAAARLPMLAHNVLCEPYRWGLQPMWAGGSRHVCNGLWPTSMSGHAECAVGGVHADGTKAYVRGGDCSCVVTGSGRLGVGPRTPFG
jgi:hypothetical protein